jgi:3-carboxy-cis,cis-muconate cycloisomerase
MLLAELMASTSQMQAVMDAPASIRAMLRTEAALAKAGAACGLVPAPAAEAIAECLESSAPDPAALAEAGALAGTIVIPLVAWAKTAVGEHAAYVHLGGTSQDIIDTGLVLQLRDGVALLQADLSRMAAAAAGLAAAHRDTKIAGRTLLQAALPSRFGLKAAYWLAAIDDSRTALAHAAGEALVLQCGGASGTLDAVAGYPAEFIDAFAAALDLSAPTLPWHTRRAPLLRLAAALAGAVGVAGKIGTDIALMMQTELAELSEPAAPGRGGSSAMAHKRNPTLSIAARAAATRMPGYLAALAGAQMQEHERAAGAWQAEAALWPPLMLCASGALAAIAEALEGLVVNPDAMDHNLRTYLADTPPGAAAALIDRALAAHQKTTGNAEK